MTTQEQIEYLATKVMGWEQEHKGEWRSVKSHKFQEWATVWNPLTDWNHWRQVEEKVMGMKNGLWRQFIVCILEEADYWLDVCKQLMKADLPTRVSALISAHQELYGK